MIWDGTFSPSPPPSLSEVACPFTASPPAIHPRQIVLKSSPAHRNLIVVVQSFSRLVGGKENLAMNTFTFIQDTGLSRLVISTFQGKPGLGSSDTGNIFLLLYFFFCRPRRNTDAYAKTRTSKHRVICLLPLCSQIPPTHLSSSRPIAFSVSFSSFFSLP